MDKKPESLVLDISDTHFGKRTGSYSEAIFYERMDRLSDRLAEIREYLSGYTFDEFRVRMFGDMVDGQEIYATQAHHQDITDGIEQSDLWSAYMSEWIKIQRRIWLPSGGHNWQLIIEAVCGNHGRTSRTAKESSSFDKSAYNQLRDKLGGAAMVEVGMGENPFFHVSEVKGHRMLMVHGHYFKSLNAVQRHVLKWNASKYLGAFKTVTYGHFHSFKEEAAGMIDTLAVGTLVTGDDHSLEVIGAEADNRWRLYGVNEKYHRTFSYDLYLD